MKYLKLSFFILFIILTSCVSRYHIGAEVHDDGYALYRPVKKEIKETTKFFEEKCVRLILKADVSELKKLCSPSLLNIVEAKSLNKEIDSIRDTFNLNGKFKIKKLHNQSYWLDEMIRIDPFEAYEFIICEYILYGQKNAHVMLFIEKEKDAFKLWGIEIHDEQNPKENIYLRYLSKEIKGWFTFH